MNTGMWACKHDAAALVFVAVEFSGCEICDNKERFKIKKDLQYLIKPLLLDLRAPSCELGLGMGSRIM